jgi:sporulation-control protein
LKLERIENMVLYKSLACLGIGGTTVDAQIEDEPFRPGDVIKGEIKIRGGQAEQQIDGIYMNLLVTVSKNGRKASHLMQQYPLSHSKIIQKDEIKKIPFQIKLPMETPMSTGSFPVYLKTGLDIKMSLDPTDLDKIEVLPANLVQKILKKIEDADFILYRIHNEYDPQQKPYPFFQMFQFRPTGRYHGYVDELNVFFQVTDMSIRMDIELIRSDRVLNSQFSWEYHDPKGTLMINNERVMQDPLEKIDEMLNRKMH